MTAIVRQLSTNFAGAALVLAGCSSGPQEATGLSDEALVSPVTFEPE